MKTWLISLALLQIAGGAGVRGGAGFNRYGAAAPTGYSYIGQAHSLDDQSNPVSTTSSLNVLSGDLLVAFCKSGGATNSMTFSDTASNTWTKGTHQSDGQIGNTDLAYTYASSANSSDSFSCSNSNSSIHTALIVLQFRGGTSGTALNLQNAANEGSVTGWTTSAFSTTPVSSVVVQCFSTGATAQVGLIGGVNGTMAFSYGNASYDTGCQYRIFTSAQTSITATINSSSSTFFDGQMGAFQ